MKWIEFSRLMQAVEYLPPNRTVSLLAKEFKEIESIAKKEAKKHGYKNGKE